MTIFFHAPDIDISHESWGLIVELRGISTETEDYYLTLQRKRQFSEQDIKFGMADVYIEVFGQGMSWYGNIDAFELHLSAVKLQLSARAAKEKGIEREIEISFPPQRYSDLSLALSVIFEGRTYYRDVGASN